MGRHLILAGVAGFAVSAACGQDFYDRGKFNAAASGAGLADCCFEDFEESTPGYNILGIPDPLTQNVPNFPFDKGLFCPITVQSNLMGDGGKSAMPRGGNGLAAVEFPGFGFGNSSDVVCSNYFVDGTDIIMIEPDVYAVGMDLVAIFGPTQFQIQVFDTSNGLLGSFGSGADAPGSSFFGFVSASPIGRINLFDPSGGNVEGGDNIQLWCVPAPGSAALLGLGGLLAGRRRRS